MIERTLHPILSCFSPPWQVVEHAGPIPLPCRRRSVVAPQPQPQPGQVGFRRVIAQAMQLPLHKLLLLQQMALTMTPTLRRL